LLEASSRFLQSRDRLLKGGGRYGCEEKEKGGEEKEASREENGR
jgi:hypothetical protein